MRFPRTPWMASLGEHLLDYEGCAASPHRSPSMGPHCIAGALFPQS